MKKLLPGLFLATLLLGAPAFSQEPQPPGPPPGPGWHHHERDIQLTDDQKQKMHALHDSFRKKREADHQVFMSQVKSILTKPQLAIFEQHEADRRAFEQGEQKAREMLKKSGQPVPAEHDDMMFEGPPMMPMMGFPPPPGMEPHDGPPMMGPHGMGPHHGGPMGMMEDLKLTSEQKGMVKVFFESFMEKQRAEMEEMHRAMQSILTPEQQQRMHPHPPPRPDGPDHDH